MKRGLRLRLSTVLVTLLAGCEGGPARDSGHVHQLEELDYFAYTEPENLEAVRDVIAGTSFPFFNEESGRFFFADAENLAEGGVEPFLESMRPTLEKVGVDLGEVTGGMSDSYDRYSVRVGGREVLIWDPDEQEEARGVGAVRAFGLVNEFLAAAGTEERLYAVGGDNDMMAVLLTPELVEFVSASVSPLERPYLPADDPPWYGMPH